MADKDGDVAYLVALGYELADLEQLSPEAIAAMAAEERAAQPPPLNVGAAAVLANPDDPAPEPLTADTLRRLVFEAILRTADDLGVPRAEVEPLLATDAQASALVELVNASVNASPPSGPPVCPLCRQPHAFGSGSCVR